MKETGTLSHLQTKRLGQQVEYWDTVSSTQGIARELALEGAKEGTLILAKEQTAGKGRMGHSWHSPDNGSIYASLILRPDLMPKYAPQLTLLSAVGIVKGIQESCGLECNIKWPNDVLYENKKCAGILSELLAEHQQIQAVILGIGLNVNEKTENFPDELQDIATSLRIARGKQLSRMAVLQHILEKIEPLYDDYLQDGFHLTKLLWESHTISVGKAVRAQTPHGIITGKARGLSEEGFMLVENEDGYMHKLSTADIRHS